MSGPRSLARRGSPAGQAGHLPPRYGAQPARQPLHAMLGLVKRHSVWRRAAMNMGKNVDQRGAPKALLGFDLFLGVTEVAGGLAILAGAISFPSEWLRGSPFSTYTAPGLVLLLVGVAA